jgi:hypothetical protein
MSKRIELWREDFTSDGDWAHYLIEMGVIDDENEAHLYNRVSFEALNIQGDMA